MTIELDNIHGRPCRIGNDEAFLSANLAADSESQPGAVNVQRKAAAFAVSSDAHFNEANFSASQFGLVAAASPKRGARILRTETFDDLVR